MAADVSPLPVAIVGGFLDHLRTLGLYDRALVILTSAMGWVSW